MSEDLTGRLADILSEKVERWLDGEEGVATFEDLLRAALEEAGAVVEPGWRKIEDAPKDTWVLATCQNMGGGYVVQARMTAGEWVNMDDEYRPDPIAWKPEPEPFCPAPPQSTD